MSAPVSLALVHYPVVNAQGLEVTTSVTTLDVHDAARVGRTFGLDRVYIVTPLAAQQALVERILRHWRSGPGATARPTRREALETVALVDSIDAARRDMEQRIGAAPRLVATHARRRGRERSARACRHLIHRENQPILLLFGTGGGLAPRVIAQTDFSLEPIDGPTGWNHLPVRAAIAIVIDRLLGRSQGDRHESAAST